MSKNTSPYFVDWAITSKCNLSCKHCRGFTGEDISTEKAKKLVAEIAELEPGRVIVEGGEPLLREDVFELLGLMRQKGLEVHFITNGMLLNHQILTTLKQLGVKVMISIDGATPETYEAIRSGADFARVVQAAKLSRFGKVRQVGRQARVAKEAAEGAYIIGEGLLGGKYKGIVDSLELRGARGTMFDHVLLKGVKPEKP